MASTFSTNLAIELIGTGDQAGTWGTTTNSNLGTLIEQAISGYVTQAVATGTDTTITIPNGSTGVARNMYIELTGTGGASTNLIVPANKKLYFIFNNSTGAVTVKVSGQTGVSVPTGKKMVLVSNGTDIVNGLNYIADFGTNSFSVTNLTASSATITNLIATSGSITNLVSSDASATVLRAGSATLTHLSATSATITNLTLTSLVISNLSIASANITTLTGSTQTLSGNLTLSGGTANGVLYLNGSKVATSGSALAFDGANLGIGTASPSALGLQVTKGSGVAAGLLLANAANNWSISCGASTNALIFTDNQFAERMRLDASGNLGIGTASPSARLTILTPTSDSTVGFNLRAYTTGADGDRTVSSRYTSSSDGNWANSKYQAWSHIWETNGTEKMRLDSSGNLGLGVTPSAWGSGFRAFETASAGLMSNTNGGSFFLMNNAYYNGTNWIYKYTSSASRYDQSAGVHSWHTAPSGTAGNAISFTQAMTLDSGGSLGIGTTSPSSIIHAAKASGNATYLQLAQTGVESWQIGMAASSSALAFLNSGSERARITSGGDLLVGSSSGTHRLTVAVASGADRDIFIAGVSGASNGFRVQWNHAALKTYVSISDIPTSSAGLPSGTLYSDGGTIKIA